MLPNLYELTRYALGDLGEQLARFIIREKLGLESSLSNAYFGDLILANGLYIEVKTIRQNKDKTYRATVTKNNSQHLGQSDYVLLQVIKDQNTIDRYVIPSDIIKTKRLFVNDKLLPYKDAYWLLSINKAA